MFFNLFKLNVAVAVVSALSATAVSVARSEEAASATQISVSAQFCVDPNSSGNCIFLFPDSNGKCISFANFIAGNGITSFIQGQAGVSCTMFSGSNCNGDTWITGMSIPNFSLLSFNGNTPDNAVNSVLCTGGV